ncbi:MAG: TIGR03960 family B12-binding radical SAM protein [Candidatus Krumholzibacteriia bacterium]
MRSDRSISTIVHDQILPMVKTPGQYAGGERNIVVKDHAAVDLKVALAFPDTYTIGMSHLGLQILYHMLNEREDTAAERVFAPWIDMEDQLRRREIPLHTLETCTPLSEFDVIGFSMQYELCFTNFMNMLELGGIPVWTEDRSSGDPVVLGGGSISLAMEPVAPFFDAVLVGDAEDVLHPTMDVIKEWRRSGLPRRSLHEALCRIPGMYVPSLYDVSYNEDGTVRGIENIPPAPPYVAKTSVRDFENAPYPTRPVVPNVSVVHERINVEIMRGCPNQCRFCQAVKHYRPLKRRTTDRIIELCEETYRNTGYDEISLTSLSTADYPGIEELIPAITRRFDARRVNISLPSLRVKGELEHLPGLVSTVRKSGLTMAPEVATDRLREIIRKPILNRDLLGGSAAAWRVGYRLIKFYFMIGVPTETREDLKGIIDLCDEASRLRKKQFRRRGRINVAMSSHIPKPHTPFQWEAMDTTEELLAKQAYIRSCSRSSYLKLKFHNVDESYLEAVFSRGDRRLADVLIKGRERGLRMDAWGECFDMRAWREVFEEARVDPDWYARRTRGDDEILPWDLIAVGTPTEYLVKEQRRARAAMA